MGAINRNGITVSKISDFYPIPALQRADADVSIILLVGNGADSLGLYQDKWYQADLPESVVRGTDHRGTSTTIQLYKLREAASPLGCAQQYQIC